MKLFSGMLSLFMFGSFMLCAEPVIPAQVAAAQTVLDMSKVQIIGVTDKDLVSYMPGETMTFTVNADFGGQTPDQEYFLTWYRSGDDGKKAHGKAKVSSEPLIIKTSIDKPGFVRMTVQLTNKAGKTFKIRNLWGGKIDVSFAGGAGAQIDKLTAGTEEPTDFDAFWQKQKARLAAVPMKYEMTKLPESTDLVDIYAVSIDCAGPRPVTGFLTIPIGAEAKSLPAQANYRGYGAKEHPTPKNGPKKRIDLTINAHGFLLRQPAAYYDQFEKEIMSNGERYALDPKQNSNPETAYFNGMVLRVLRSLEFLKVLPQWNGKDLIVNGGSQGGLQTIWAAALDPDVTYATPAIPWCCDLNGAAKGRIDGWHPKYVPALGYYDAVNHAKRIKCPVDITRAGLGDYLCPPSGIAVLYNAIKSPKSIKWYQGSSHGYIPKDPQIFEIKNP
ncbi:MAG: acetylxylan esterase [Victivallales bacterium]|jgi:cephalosporin-C deacetylase-like acetyl esterase|nr:acetylxylan esterase [Victivallales bacterium]